MAQTPNNIQQISGIRSRTLTVFAVIACCFFLLAGRLIYLQAIRHSYFLKEAEAYRVRANVLPADRGQILDRNGTPLATNVPAKAIFADPIEVGDAAGAAAKLAPVLGMDVARLQALLTPKTRRSHYVSLMRHAPVEVGAAVAALRLPGIGMIDDKRRAYPNSSLACQVLGFTDRDLNGIEGIERSQDAQLQGADGLLVAEVDHRGRIVPGTVRTKRPPRNGHDLYLTIDATLQHASDEYLAAAVKEHGARNGVAIVLDPNTGEILALSNAPSYDPNHPRPAAPVTKEQAPALEMAWRNHAVSDLYEPGSTLKTITASAVLQDLGLQEEYVKVHCAGSMQIGNHTIHCAKDPPYYGVHGEEDLRGVLKESCNIGMAQFGFKLGADNLFKFEHDFGFLDPPGTGMPGEAHSTLQSPADFNRHTGSIGWSRIQFANIAFGQGVSISPLQLAAAYGAIANGGNLMQPHIIKAIGQGDKILQVAPVVVRKVLDPKVAEETRSLLQTVVEEGTGKPAQIGGFSVGGKTGSAQVSGPRGYEAGKYVASFVGLVPLQHPRFVILCAVFEPTGVHWGAAVAAPVVHNIAKIAVREMHLAPDAPQLVDWEDRHRRLSPQEQALDDGLPGKAL